MIFKSIDIVKSLAQKTDEGHLVWQSNDAKDCFNIFTSEYGIYLLRKSSKESKQESEVILQILDRKDAIVVQISESQLRSEEGSSSESLARLYGAAKRVALKLDQDYEKILNSLEEATDIWEAAYGYDDKWHDVTATVREKVKSGGLTRVSNHELGGDPYPGNTKKLRVTYIERGQKLTKIFDENAFFKLP